LVAVSTKLPPIYKKGDKTKCTNYRGIALLNVSYKVLSNILYEKLNVYAEEILGDYQCGFRIGRSTTDQCFTMSQIFEKCHEFNINIHCLFIDYKQAFDKLSRNYIDYNLKILGIPQKYINLINMTLAHSNAKVILNGEMSDEFDMKSGVRQGDSLSTLLFNLTLHAAINEIDRGGTIFYKSTQICAYADDIVIIARNKESLQNAFIQLEQATRPAGLRINEEKTKYMARSPQDHHIRITGYNFESIEEFKYLGVVLSINKDPSLAIQDRIQAANRSYFAHINLMKSKLLSKEQKLRIYKTIIRPVLTYGCETWVLKTNDVNLLQRFERKILRKIFGPVRLEDGSYRIRYNDELNNLIEGRTITRFAKAQRLRWYGHMLRMSNDRMPKRIFETKPDGIRRKGRPRRRWLQDVENDLRTMRIAQHRRKAECRDEWRRIVEEAMVHPGL